MIFKEEKGAAFILVLIVMIVMTALGGAFAFVANTEGKQSVRRSEREQAYYYARSGVEAGYEYLLQLEKDDELENFLEDEEVDFSGDFLDLYKNVGTDGTEDVYVKISVDDNDEREIIIDSIGRYGRAEAEEDITLRLIEPDDFPPDIGDVDIDSDAEELDWKNPQGNLQKSGKYDGNVLFPEGNADELQPGQTKSYEADNFYYDNSLSISQEHPQGTKLAFIGYLTVFYDKIDFEAPGANEPGSLCFKRINDKDHIVHFEEDVIKDNGDVVKPAGSYMICPDEDKACLPDNPEHLVPYDEHEFELEDFDKYWE